jgi:tetratricopeptide (TPR) repeat protein
MQCGNARNLTGCHFWFSFLAFFLGATSFTYGQVAGLNDLSEDEQKQVEIAERFVTVLEKNPRRGTALDRVYGHHVEFGTLDGFMQSLRDRVKQSPNDGTGWMLLGLFEAHRGEDANAIDALKKAEEFLPGDALASYYLGQSLLLLGQPEEAVAAFERAIARNPRRTDLLEIFQQLGRVHQRAQRTEEALAVWQRLEALFPDDPRVQEQIAVTLVEEGEYGLALPRYENLAKLVSDDYRRTMFRIEAAELKIRESRRDEGVADFETLLADLNPESWLHRDVRRRIEDVYLRSGNQDGLVTYYEKWIASHADDVDGMARLAKFLASSARVPEATQWMSKALKLAPTRTELRKSFIDQLVDDQRYGEAIKEYELLVESAPGNSDFVRDWGKLVLKNKELTLEARHAEASRIWNQILAARPDDALTMSQVADLFRQSNMQDEALALYQRAVAQAPNEPQYREYLGEFYHILKRPDEALATWTAIAEGARHTAINVARLAEIYNSFGYLDQAILQIAEACKLDAKDFALHLKASEYHSRANKFDEALAFIGIAEKLAANVEEQDATVAQRIEVYRSSRRLDAEIDALAEKVHGNADASTEQWQLLARYREADSRWADATEAIDTALKKDAKSIPALTTAGRIAELSGDYARAADMNRQLAVIDRRSRGDHLMNVARLEAQMGRADEALAAGRELIVSAPGNTDNYEFYARLCFQLGKSEEGVDTLRKAVRINPTEPHLIMALGSALSEEFRADEAIEVYWRAFEKTDDLDDKTSLTMKLTDLYLQVNQFDKLLERLERDRREEDKRHATTICLAQAHHSAGDYGTARQELESLLSENTRDTNLLQQLSKLCEQGADADGAIEYQRQLAVIAPGHETEYRLASLLQSRGDRDEASEILVKLMRREEDPARRLRNLDSLLTQGAYESVISITEPLLSEQHDDWEVLYREAIAWASLDKLEEAQDRFDRLLALAVAHDAFGVVAEDKFKQAQTQARSNNLRGIQSTMPTRRSPLTMLRMSAQVRQAVGLDPDRHYYSSSAQAQPMWMPDAFGEARMAAYAWLMLFDQEQESDKDANIESSNTLEKRFEELGALAMADGATRETVYDWMYVEQLRGNLDSIFRIARRMAQEGGREAQQFYLTSLSLRGVDTASQQVPRSQNDKPKKTPLSDDDLELMLQCQEALTAASDDDAYAATMGGQVIHVANGQAYIQLGNSYVPLSTSLGGGAYVGIIIDELKLSGRTEQAEQLIQKQIDSAKSSSQLAVAMNMFLQEGKYDRIDALFPKWLEAARDDIARGPTVSTGTARRSSSSQVVDPMPTTANLLMTWMGHLGPEEEHAKILSLLEASLDISTDVAMRKRAEQTRRRTTSATQSRYNTSFTLKYGKEDVRVQFDYPHASQYVDATTLMLLRAVYEVFKRNEVLDDLPAYLEQRLQAASDDEKLYATLLLAYTRWWLEEKEEALTLLKKAGAYLNDDPAFRLEIATLHQSMGDTEDALEIVEAIVPRDQKLVQQRELIALELAERLGDIDRARQAAERLFGLRLDNNTQLALVDRMRRLGMHEMAEAITSRVERRSGNSLPAMASLMAMYQSQGKADLAQQLAHTILRRSTPPLSGMGTAGRNPFRYASSSSEAQMRTQSLRLLQQTGVLKDLIARVEGQIEKSPNSPQLYEQLIEYYEAANEREKVGSLLVQAVANRPDAVVLRYQLAKHLEATGKQAEACDQYLELLKQKPQWVSEDLYQVRRVFERSNRTLDLIQAIEKINIKLFSQPYYVIDLVSGLMDGRRGQANDANLELALNLFEKVFDAFPQYRHQMVSRMRDQNLWKNERVFNLGKQAIIPTVSEVAAAPWFGLDNISSYSSGGQVNAQFHQMLTGIQGSEKMAELAQLIQGRLTEAPGWHGGEAMLALIDLKENRKEQAKERLGKLVADEDTLKAMPAHSCWIIGQELDQFEDTRPIALKLFETALNSPNTMSQIQYSPVARLVKLYGDIGRKQDARDLLVKQSRSTQDTQYDPQYSSYLRIENSVWAAQQLLQLQSPVDAVRIFRNLSTDPTAIEQAGKWYGNQPNHFKSQIDQGLKLSLNALDSANSDEAMTQLLALPEHLPAGAAALDLMLLVPDISNLRTTSMQSPLVDLLVTISNDEAIANGIRKRLNELRAEHTADVSIGVTESVYLLRMQDKQATEALQALVAAVADHPLEAIQPGRRPNSRQRREGLSHIPLWLIARECLQTKEQREIGVTLAERALEAARRQTSDQHTAAILYDWGRIALDRGDRDQAEAKWSELLDVVTKRPEPKQPAAKPRTSSFDTRNRDHLVFVHLQVEASDKQPAASRRIPPLTVSQFRLTMEIALAAAENNMPALSRKAVKASMLGGTPVPDDASPTVADPFGGGRTVRTPAAVSAGLSQIETDVAESLRKVIAKWAGDAYPALEVYELLVPIVFPENRSAEILMYADSSKLHDAQVSSLGAVLVQWAQTAKQLDDLRNRIDERTQNPQSKVAALVLRTQVALALNKLDDAKLALTELAQRVGGGSLPPLVQLACHAALPASDRKGLEEPAYEILKAAVNLQLQTPTADQNNNALSLGGLVSKVNLYLVDEPEEVKKFFETYLIGRQSHYSRYSGTYGQYLQWQDWAAIAEEAAKTGLPTIALDYIGRVADFSYENRARPSTTTAMAVVCREMSLLPPEKQYEAWRDWTLPVEGRTTIRLAAEWVEPVPVPQNFLETAKVLGEHYFGDMLSNFTELLAAAEAAGRMEELRDLVKPAHDQKLENASFLYALVLIQIGDTKAGTPVIQSLIDTVTDRVKRQTGQPTPDGWGDFLVYRACLQSPQFVSLYQTKKGSLQRALQSISDYQKVARLDIDYAIRVGQSNKPTIQPGDDPQLAHWFPASTQEKFYSGVTPWWVAQEGHLAHLPGAGVDLLYFKYPLTGDFEFTVDAYKGSWAETEAGYGGIVVEAQRYGSRTTVWSIGGHETFYQGQSLQRDNETFGTITIKVAKGRMQYLLNNHVIYEEEVNDTSPWITLYSHYTRATTFRTPRFTGNPVIPREVALVHDDRMDGWNTSFFGTSQPRRRLMALKPASENDNNAYAQRNEPTEFGWQAKDGLLVGRANAEKPLSRSWAYYHRPLLDQETFSYEFYYSPGQVVAHPTIGRLALLLEAAGVEEHWITRTGWDEPVLGVSNSNRLANPTARRGPGPIPLKQNDWNLVRLGLVGDAIQITLNEELIYERPLDPEIDHRFGLFHRQGQSLKVREPKLTGAWPASLTDEIRNDLLASTKKYTTADRRLINTLLSEEIFQHDVAGVLADAKQLAPEQAYDKLLAWVLPSPDHSLARLYFDFVSGHGSTASGQEMRCPAIELMATAERLGKLDELTKAIGEIKTYGEVAERSKIALAALAAMQSGDLELAYALMIDLYRYVAKGLSKDLTARARAPELVVAWQALQHPALHFAAWDITDELITKQRDDNFKKSDPIWDTSLDVLLGRVDRAMLSPGFKSSTESRLTQWVNVPYDKPNVRAAGYDRTEWLYQPGVVRQIPGGTWGQLFFQSPLKGNFEIVAEQCQNGYRDAVIAYGMHSVAPRWDFKARRVTTLMHNSQDIDGQLDIPNPSDWVAEHRIVIDGNTVTTFVKGVQIHEEKFASAPDPWVVLQAYGAGYPCTVRDLRIVGSPEIPDEIDLINCASFGAWRADTYGESISLDADNATTPWRKSGGEIVGQLRQNIAAANVESLLLYQRPMLEDGVIEFEAFYVPGEFAVHPAVGRIALMVNPDGVRTHTLTDAQYETSGLAPDNVAPIEGAAASVDLKPNDWNRYKLSLTGDRLTLTINNADVATITLTELPTERFFGLFRYSDKSKCRVRNLVYRGNWPKALPAIEQQQLARVPANEFANWSAPRVFDFSEPKEKLVAAGLQIGGPADRIMTTDRGLHMLVKESTGYGSWPRIHLREPIADDFVVTLDYENLSLQPPQEGWGCNFVLRAIVGGTSEKYVDSGIGCYHSPPGSVNSVRNHKTLSGADKHDGRYKTVPFGSGRLRLVRTGAVISTYFTERDSDDFRLWDSWPVGDAPLKEITVQSAASDAIALLDLVVTRMTIQTRKSPDSVSLAR